LDFRLPSLSLQLGLRRQVQRASDIGLRTSGLRILVAFAADSHFLLAEWKRVQFCRIKQEAMYPGGRVEPPDGGRNSSMRVFDQTDRQTLERREWELWLLTIGLVLILAGGVGLLMYPMVFSRPTPFSVPAMRRIFYGYCALSVLIVVYLVGRQRLMRQLRRQLIEEVQRNTLLRQKASLDLLGSLPRFSRFQDRLAMDFRRALNSQQPLSLLIAELKPSDDLTSPMEIDAAYGDAANALIRRLRADDSIYIFEHGIFGVLLPATNVSQARQMSSRLDEALADASGVAHRFSFRLQLLSYPEQAKSARELEETARACVTEGEAGSGSQAA
jgi:GGDEF domain-containing protein